MSKLIMMKKAKLTPISDVSILSSMTIDLLSCKGIEFRYDNGYTEMNAPNMRCWVRILEGKEEIEAYYASDPKEFKVRDTDEILIEGNTDKKKTKWRLN